MKKGILAWLFLKLVCNRGLVGTDIDNEEGETTEEETGDLANEGDEGQDPELDDEGNPIEPVEYELDEDGEVVTDEEGNPVVKQATEEEGAKADHKKGAQERIQQLANEKRDLADRLKRLEDQFSKAQAEKPDFVDIDMGMVNEYIQTTGDQIEEMKLEGKYLEAKKLEIAVAKLINDIEENDKKRAEFGEKQNKNKATDTAQAERLTNLDNAANFYRDNQKIEPAVWDKMGNWFAAQCQTDPILGREFAEMVDKGAMGAIRWAHDYTTKHMGIKEKAAINDKNLNKTKAAAASPTPGGKSGAVDLAKALKKATEANTDAGWAEYQQLKRAAKR